MKTFKTNIPFLKSIRRAIKVLSIAVLLVIVACTAFVNIVGQKKELSIPVSGAKQSNWDSKSYWYSPWGKSRVHKGIDIFAPQKTEILSPVTGLILWTGYSENGGNYLYILGPKFRTYYFAHLNTQEKKSLSFVREGARIGAVGNSGNAIGSPYHLHFSIYSIFPIVKYYDEKQPLGWLKMFYLDPVRSLVI